MKKVFIFDFDGTLYSGENIFSQIPEFIDKFKRSFLPNISDNEYDLIIKENPSWLEIYSGQELANHIYSFIEKYPNFDISINAFRKWELNVIEPINIDKNETIDTIFLKKLCKENPVYIVSNSDIIHVKHYMKKLKVNPKWFKNIICNQFIKEDVTKQHYYKDILGYEQCEANQAFVFGDSYNSDILPAQKLGINAFLVKNVFEITKIIEEILNNF